MITKTVNSYIRYIVKVLGANIAVLNLGGEYEYIAYTDFQPSQSGGSATIDFCSVRGIVITEFFKTTVIDLQINKAGFDMAFQSYIEREEELLIKYNKAIDYMLFVKP